MFKYFKKMLIILLIKLNKTKSDFIDKNINKTKSYLLIEIFNI